MAAFFVSQLQDLQNKRDKMNQRLAHQRRAPFKENKNSDKSHIQPHNPHNI